jgi:hypothetical protein
MRVTISIAELGLIVIPAPKSKYTAQKWIRLKLSQPITSPNIKPLLPCGYQHLGLIGDKYLQHCTTITS